MVQFNNNLNQINQDFFCVIDLETTGTDPLTDQIIEVGVLVFKGDEIINSFESLVKSSRPIPPFVTELTGISDFDLIDAPEFDSISEVLTDLIKNLPIVGHNVNFDLGFLKNYGLSFDNLVFDTLDLSYVFFPKSPSYSLQSLKNEFKFSVQESHRALADCQSTMHLFNEIVNHAKLLPSSIIGRLSQVANSSNWIDPSFFQYVLINSVKDQKMNKNSHSGSNKLDNEDNKLQIEEIFSTNGKLSQSLQGFEYRAEQNQMALNVQKALENKKNLIVEAGTGVGKSLAYLIPAINYSINSNEKIVISTNTIGLQEQLIDKDLPLVMNILGLNTDDDTNFSLLKGRSNYLCLQKFESQVSLQTIDTNSGILMSKIIVWLHSSNSGDLNEMNISRSDHRAILNKFNAEKSLRCMGLEGQCFLRQARNKANESNAIIVNHSLLMSDLISEGSILPPYENLIIDEAHHIEDQASSAFAFSINRTLINDLLSDFVGSENIYERLRRVFTRDSNPVAINELGILDDNTQNIVRRLQENFASLFSIGFLSQHLEISKFKSDKIRVSANHQINNWEDLADLSDNLIVLLEEFLNVLNDLIKTLETKINLIGITEYLGITEASYSNAKSLTSHLLEFFSENQKHFVYWILSDSSRETSSFNGAPFVVGDILYKELFSQKESVVLTSATLTSDEKFEHINFRTGFHPDESLILGSPFDYQSSALLLIPNDIPDPRNTNYLEYVASAIKIICEKAPGGVLVLFTSYSALNTVYDLIKKEKSLNKNLLAQGIHGSPRNLLQIINSDNESLILGTSSFWEGVDLKGSALNSLVITRLPFDVPSDPIYQARFENYANGFNEFAVPNAIMKFRQGFGRLIRSKDDKGVIVVLDNRIVKAPYGKRFVKSLPNVPVSHTSIHDMGSLITQWFNHDTEQ